MNKSTGIGVLAIVLVIIVLGGWYWSSLARSGSPCVPSTTTNCATPAVSRNTSQATGQTSETGNVPTSPMTATVMYTANGFSPDPVTIKQGGTVTFVDNGGGSMWIASNAHPTHMQYSGTSKKDHCPDTAGVAFDECSTGTSYSFTFQKAGSWNYHNHVNADDGGTVIVTP